MGQFFLVTWVRFSEDIKKHHMYKLVLFGCSHGGREKPAGLHRNLRSAHVLATNLEYPSGEEETNWLVKQYHRLLVWDLMKNPTLTRILEKIMNPIMGKSVVMYFRKEATS